MTFYRYQYRYADGPGDWDYIESSLDAKELSYELELRPEAGADSMHYRGVTVEPIPAPPVKWLTEKATHYELMANRYCDLAKRYHAMAHGMEGR